MSAETLYAAVSDVLKKLLSEAIKVEKCAKTVQRTTEKMVCFCFFFRKYFDHTENDRDGRLPLHVYLAPMKRCNSYYFFFFVLRLLKV